jgi:hypothetical protein
LHAPAALPATRRGAEYRLHLRGCGSREEAAMRNGDESVEVARECLRGAVARLTGAVSERRHEPLLEWAVAEVGLERGYAEQVYALAEEVELEPVYAFLLVRCGLGVIELEAPPEEGEDEGAAAQQAPPKWLDSGTVELDDITLERRLRATFRRFRGHLESAPDAASAVDAYAAEPDVEETRLR